MNDYLEYTSLCLVPEKNDNEPIRLVRMADIIGGKLIAYNFNGVKEQNSDYIDKIYCKECQLPTGYWGIWNWSIEPRSYSNIKECRLNLDVRIVEIINIKNAHNWGNLVSALKNGVQANPVSQKIMITCALNENLYTGLLCDTKQLISSEMGLIIDNDVDSLFLYNFQQGDIIWINGKAFYKYTTIPQPVRQVPLKKLSDTVKDAIIHRATWSVLKNIGVTRRDWTTFKSFLSEMPNESLYSEIATHYSCSEETAKKSVDNFINNACSYINQDDIESNVLEAIINTHPALKAKCEELAAEQWRVAHVNEIAAADEKLQLLVHKNTQQQQQYDKLVSDTKITQDKYTALQIEIDNLESLGKDVEQKTQLRIENARKNAADFISSLAFIPSYTPQNAVPSTIQSQAQSPYETGAPLEQTEQDISPNWETTLDYLSCELRKAGVKGDMAFNFAAFIYSAIFVNHSTLLMAGPYGTYIANAFSTVLYGRKAGCLDCSLKYNAESINTMLNSDDKVVIIKNPLNAGWIEHITECLCSFDKHFILTYPFAEDLLIEPRGLFNYMLPVLTEFVIDINKVPSDNFIGSVNDENYVSFDKVEKTGIIHPRALQQLNMGMIVKQRIQHILFDAHTMSDSFTDTDDYLFSIFPYACATGQSEKLSNILCETPLKSNEVQASILAYLGVKNE